MKTKALAVKPLNSLNLRSMLVTNNASREYVHPTKPVSITEPLTFAEIMFELDDVPNAHDDLFEDLELPDQHYRSRLSALLKPMTPIGAALQRNTVYSALASKGCLHRLEDSLTRIGYNATTVSSVAAADNKKGSFASLRHQYVSINLDMEEYIVDPSFKDHFVVQNPTTRYAAVLALIPDTAVVASRQQLLRAVAFLATELQRCFDARRVALPPWRRLKSLLSKWEAATPVVNRRMPSKEFSTTAVIGTQFTAHSFPKAASTYSPQSILENQALLKTESRAYPRKFVGFQVDRASGGNKGDECVCCGLRIHMLRQSARQNMHCVVYSAPAA